MKQFHLLAIAMLWQAWAHAEEATMMMDHSHMHHPQAGGMAAHDNMSQQGAGTAEVLRDPHAYADGYTLTSMPFYEHTPHAVYSLLIDRLESVITTSDVSMTYDLQAWGGQTYNRALIRAEGEMQDGRSENARTELLWAHAISPYWDSHLGIRYDSGSGRNRGWLALGVQGLAPYWLYTEATFYVNEQGRTAFRVELEYDVLITQALILQPRIEANLYGKNDAAHALGNGLANIEMGLRLRYELRREFAPYIGVEWASTVGNTAHYAQANGETVAETRFVAGVHCWF